MQDYRRLQAKVEKYEEKEKTGPVLARLHQVPSRGVGSAALYLGTNSGLQGQAPGVLIPLYTHTVPPAGMLGEPVRAVTARVSFPGPRRASARAGRL